MNNLIPLLVIGPIAAMFFILNNRSKK